MQMTWQAVYDLVCRHGARPGADLCACAAADAESERNPDVPPGDGGISWGLWQLEQGVGLGGDHTADELRDPDVAADIMVPLFNATYQDGLKAGHTGEALVRYCCMYTERPFGFPDLHSPAADRYAAAWYAAVAALSGEEPTTMTYNPDQPPERQVQPWSCSIRTATWMLRSLGIDTDAARMQDLMVPDYVTPELGLLQGDGTGMAQLFREHFGLIAEAGWTNWADLCERAGTEPIGLGSGSLYHWVAVRRLNADGTLALSNPAPGYQGLYDTMTEAQFNQWAPWARVYIAVPAENGGDDLSQAERDELDEYHQVKPYYDTLLGTPDNPGGVIGAALTTMDTAAGTSKTALAKVVREQVASVRQAAGLE